MAKAAVVTVAFALCLLGGSIQADGAVAAPRPGAYLVAVLSCTALTLRHRAPLAALAGTTVTGALAQPLGMLSTPLIVAPALVATYVYALVTVTERRVVAVLSLASAVLLVTAAPVSGSLSWRDATRMVLMAVLPPVAGVLGRSVRHRRAYLAALEERALRAVAEERIRIARELHDLVAHQITLANAQATVAEHLFDVRPEQTRVSLRQLVETTGHALDALRATVGLLRQSGDDAVAGEPAPGLGRLPELLDAFRSAGLEVSVHSSGPAQALAPDVDLAAYRIVQEALTNVTKHAATGAARVGLAWTPDLLTVTVTDDGTGAGPAPGYGLIGMRERATAAGGRFAAGPRPEGGFLVTAELPLQGPA
ncbi:sensor histidine kinase [Catenuloplanes indicus]|uniref:histidine kinase n=1 Tax=Catenuloplanes indicus TaxID=137267 RepID=A0AAE3W6D0_9ACTN|nr:sensor histidine kinase [Catenuloplanes indicus]MDQ0370107.1 signal transduction histidine kinase [Catenuloplanes indicus]